MQTVPARPRIVVADDHAAMRTRMVDLLAGSFDVVAAVADGQAAVAATEALAPDVVVLDISMPVLNGIQAAAAIRRLSRVPRYLFVTAVDDQHIAAALLSFGASTLVLKREMLDELVPAVRHAVSTPYTHAFCVHRDAAFLCRTAARFVADGLVVDQPALIIATATHTGVILDHLVDVGIDLRARMAQGDLVVLDADRLLAQGATEDLASVFGREVLPILERLRRGGEAFPRLYGETGGLLWERGKAEAALKLEAAWNSLDISRRCSVLCGYAEDAVGDEGFRKLCHQHDQVVPAS